MWYKFRCKSLWVLTFLLDWHSWPAWLHFFPPVSSRWSLRISATWAAGQRVVKIGLEIVSQPLHMAWLLCSGFAVCLCFSVVAASAFGSLLYDLRYWVARVGGIVVIIFGLHMTGVFRITFLEYDMRVHDNPDRKRGYIASFLMGVFFSAGWSPCIGPVLGTILILAVNGRSVALGTGLLIAYSSR